jgi:sodium-dependent dicarboxylate transporter 2/3/5
LLGSALSLAITIEHNGTANWIVAAFFPGVSYHMPQYVYVVAVAFTVFLIRSMFTSPVAAITVLFPIIKAFALTVGLNVFYALAITVIMISATMIIPINSPIMVIAFETGYLSLKEHVILSIIVVILSILVAGLSYYFYWPFINEA